MATDNSAGGAPGGTGGDNQDPDNQNPNAGGADDKVSYGTYKATVDEVKKLKAELKARDEKLSRAETEKLEAEGKKDELIAALKKQTADLEKQHKSTLNNFIYSSLDSQVREEAVRLGCVDPDAVVRLADLSKIEVDQKTFKADKKDVTDMLEGLKKDKPYLFNKSAPKINNRMPNGKPPGENDEKPEKEDLSKLSADQLRERIRAIDKAR